MYGTVISLKWILLATLTTPEMIPLKQVNSPGIIVTAPNSTTTRLEVARFNDKADCDRNVTLGNRLAARLNVTYQCIPAGPFVEVVKDPPPR